MASKIVVLGGNGFVGSHVCKLAVARGFQVVGLSRSGSRPAGPAGSEAWADKVSWRAGDALDEDAVGAELVNAAAVVVAIGSPPLPFVDKDYQIKMNGATNTVPLEAAAKLPEAPRAVLVGATMPSWIPEGYGEGKRMADEAARAYAAQKGVAATVLKPGVVSGTRYEGSVPIPVGAFMLPLTLFTKNLPGVAKGVREALPGLAEGALVTPADVHQVAAAAMDAASGVSPFSEPGYHEVSWDELSQWRTD